MICFRHHWGRGWGEVWRTDVAGGRCGLWMVNLQSSYDEKSDIEIQPGVKSWLNLSLLFLYVHGRLQG